MLPDAGRSLLRGQDPLLPEGHHLRRRDGRLHFQLRKPPPRFTEGVQPRWAVSHCITI